MTPATGNCQGCLVPSKVLHSWQKNRQQLAGILGLVHADSVLTIPVHQQSFLSKVKSAKDRASELPPPACQGPQAGVGATESFPCGQNCSHRPPGTDHCIRQYQSTRKVVPGGRPRRGIKRVSVLGLRGPSHSTTGLGEEESPPVALALQTT